MISDFNLEFLSSCSNKDLRVLSDLLTHDRNGNLRLTGELVTHDKYLQFYPKKMWILAPEIAYELRKFGSNTISTFFRGEPDSYETILKRVCKKMHIEMHDDDNVMTLERNLLTEFCGEVIDKLSESELRLFANEYGIPTKNFSRQAIVAALMMALRVNRQLLNRIAAKVMQELIELLVIRGAVTIGAETAGRVAGAFLGPLGWAVMGVWTIYDIASPAYRVCFPAVLQVALMRLTALSLPQSSAA